MPKNLFIDDNLLEHQIFQLMVKKFLPEVVIEYSDDPEQVMTDITAHAAKPDLLPGKIILDLNMPKYSGYDFLKDMNQLQSVLSKPVDIYIFSSSISPQDVQLFRSYPFIKAYIVKPLTEAKLKQIFSVA